MGNPKGTAFESLLLPLLRQHYPDAERLRLQGAKDRGDFTLPGERRFILEAKNQSKLNLAGWWSEAEAEALHAYQNWYPPGAIGRFHPTVAPLVVHKRHGKGKPEDQWVTTTLGYLLPVLKPLED